MVDRLVLGTVQLGMPYGINNKIGKPDLNSARDIIKTAFEQGITRFDTSQAYGDSEEVLGGVLEGLKINTKVKVYSKLDPKLNLCDKSAVRKSVEGSLRKLRIDQLEGLLIHNEDGLSYWNKGLSGVLAKLVAEGKVKSVGASFYTPQKAFDALDIDGIDIIQVPANILDRRFENIGVFSKAKECGKGVYIRSVFLQGLLLMDLDKVPASMQDALPYLKRLEQMASDMKLNRRKLAFSYACCAWPNALIIFGAESVGQICENMAFAKYEIGIDLCRRIGQEFSGVEERILNPTLWSK